MPPTQTPRPRIATHANALTASRLALTPVLAWAIASGLHALALACFALAVASDLADGRVARRRGEASALGGFLDHATDALFVASGIAALASRSLAPALLPVLVLASFAQYALDSRALAGRPLRASALGRTNGIAYFVLVGVPVVRDGLRVGWPSDALLPWLGWTLVATTCASMLDRALALRAARR
jgi:phosphatidylglycerophosphate synthase